MSAIDPQVQHLLNPQSSSLSNHHHGDYNPGNQGIIGNGSRNVLVSGIVNAPLNIQVPKTDENELDKVLLPDISKDALHDSMLGPPVCHEGTRTIVCNAIVEWASDSAGSPLLWLYGPAGVGKSVIAKTISMGSSNQIRVVASFFFSTSSEKNAATLFPTLAWQLAKNVPETEQHIVAALNRNRLLPKSRLELQLDRLIVEPLKKCETRVTSGLVMVIDGVDECVDENIQNQLLDVLKRAAEKGNLPLRFLICSRPERRINAILGEADNNDAEIKPPSVPQSSATVSGQFGITISSPEQQSLGPRRRVAPAVNPFLQRGRRLLAVLPSDAWKLYQPMKLSVDSAFPSSGLRDKFDHICCHPVVSRIQIGSSEESKKDIAKFIRDKFKAIPPSKTEGISWGDIDELAKRSCGQFLYASTIVKLLDDPDWYPKDVLDMALSSTTPSPDLDKLYLIILHKAQDVAQLKCNQQQVTLKDVLAILVVLWQNVQFAIIPESFPIVQCLLGLGKDELMRKLQKMHSILHVVPGKSIRAYHRSFFEFLQHSTKSDDQYIAYPSALRRFLVLLGGVVLRYPFRRLFGQLIGDDKKGAECIRKMVLAFPRQFFGRSANPTKLATAHALFHSFCMYLLWVFSIWFSSRFWTVLRPRVFFVQYLLIMGSFPIIAFVYFTVILKYYTWNVDRSIPLFHPFLLPVFVKTTEFLLSI